MTRLPMTSSQDLNDSLLTSALRMRPFEHSLRHLKDNLDDSENRRVVLVHKLKEAQETLELQNDRLNRIEGTAKTNSVLVDDLKYKEKEYRDKINALERSEDEKRLLKSENDRLRDEMQSRIDKLDFQLRSLQAQHQVSETENIKRSNLLEQSTTALSLLENENTKLKKDKDALRHEILVAKEAMELAREKFGPMEDQNRSLRHEMERIKETYVELKEENERLAHKAQSSTSKLNELKDLTETMREENEKLASSWKQLSEEKQKLAREIDSNQETHREARARVTNLATERDRLFNEKMEMTSKIQQLMIDKEQIEKTKIALEEQIAEQEEELARIRKGVKRKDEERRLLEETVHESKQNYDDLFKELSNVRAYYERSLEQISVLENNKQLAMQQLELSEHEKDRLRNENERLRESVEGKSRDLRNEREQLEEAVLDLKEDLRQMKQEKTKSENKIQELEIKLEKANESVKEISTLKQGEIDNLKSACDRLSASNAKKETELEGMTEKIQHMEIQHERLREELKTYKEDCEQLQDQVEDIKKLKDENRRLLQEKAENEQVIKLLETQKEVLSKSADSSMEKLKDIDKLTDKITQYRSENEHLRSRISELEKVRDNLIAQKEELLANSELIYKKPQMEELEAKIAELRDANKQLREINEQVNEKAEMLQQENVTLKDAVGGDGSVVPRVELERLTREKERLQSDLDHLKQEHENLEERHQRFIIQYGHEGSETQKDKETISRLEREKEALEKTVALINGQMLLVEGGKKRLDDVVDDLQTEIVSLRQQLEEAEKKNHSSRHQPEVEALQEEVNILNEQLDEAKYEQDKQRRLIQTLKDDIEEERNKKPTQIRSSVGQVQK